MDLVCQASNTPATTWYDLFPPDATGIPLLLLHGDSQRSVGLH